MSFPGKEARKALAFVGVAVVLPQTLYILAALCSLVLVSGVIVVPVVWTLNPALVEKARKLSWKIFLVARQLTEEHIIGESEPPAGNEMDSEQPNMRNKETLKRDRKGLIHRLRSREISGHSFQGPPAKILPQSVWKQVNTREKRIPDLVVELESSLRPVMAFMCSNGRTCIGKHGFGEVSIEIRAEMLPGYLMECLHLVDETFRRVCGLPDEIDPSLASSDDLCTFVTFKGASVIVNFLLCTIPVYYGGRGKFKGREKTQVLRDPVWESYCIRIWQKSLLILREVSVGLPNFAAELSSNKPFFDCLIRVLRIKELFDFSLQLCEELLCMTEEVIEIDSVDGFCDVIMDQSYIQLSTFCRLLSLFFHEREEVQHMSNPTSIGLIRLRSKCQEQSVVQNNQRIVVDNPEILQRLIQTSRLMTRTFDNNQRTPRRDEGNEDAIDDISNTNSDTRTNEIQQFLDGIEAFSEPNNGEVHIEANRRDFAAVMWFLSQNGFVNQLEPAPERLWEALPEPLNRDEMVEHADSYFLAQGSFASDEHGNEVEISQLVAEIQNYMGAQKVFLTPDDWFGVETVDGGESALLRILSGLLPEETLPSNISSEAGERMMLNWITQQVEVLFVIGALSGGKHKEEVNNLLASFGLVRMLDDLFVNLKWGEADRSSPHIHGANCECNPQVSLKVQFLRVIHNFCDREASRSNKRLLLSEVDLRVCRVLALNREKGLALANSVYGEQQMSMSLLEKLVVLLKREEKNSQYRFWIASTIEAFLHGGTNEEQYLLYSWGLMDHLVEVLLEPGSKEPGIRQTCFDLLGELIKLNKFLFEMLAQMLDHQQVQFLTRVAMTHLVDSNVFIRTVFISLESFRNDDAAFVESHPFEIILNQHRVGIVRSLMTVVELEQISQENISCLNTALLILMFARRSNSLPQLLQAVEDLNPDDVASFFHPSPSEVDTTSHSDCISSCCADSCATKPSEQVKSFSAQGTTPLVNFRRLLWFWRQYYRPFNRQDRVALSNSSRIPFSDWVDIVDLLCADDGSSTSLLRDGQKVQVPTLLDFLKP